MLVHDPLDNLLDPLWYCLEGGDIVEKTCISGNIQIFVLMGTQGMELGRTIRGSTRALRSTNLQSYGTCE
ncbi:hypothetical protein NL676_001193 [Syzygium grande]|nr:hypothetical protein NL676_001193 [Syzygium grande]